MDLFIVVIVVAMILLVMLVVAALHVQQSGQLRDIQARLMKLDEAKAEPEKSAETLRLERTQWLDPLSQLEPLLDGEKRTSLTEDELQQISATRESVKAITDSLKAMNEWMGPPFDLEWTDYLDRLPRLKSLYMRADLQPAPPAAITSGS